MKNFDELVAAAPPGVRVGGSKHSAAESLRRKRAIAVRVLRAGLDGVAIKQKADIAALPELTEVQSLRGLGDYLGRGRRGLDLDLVRDGDDWLIEPTAWNATKAWRWIKANADPTQVAEELDFESVEALEALLIAKHDELAE